MKLIELVILLNGNFVTIPSEESKRDDLNKVLVEAVKAGHTDPLHFLSWGAATVLSKSIVGWYFRTPVKSAADKALGILEKALPSGEDWKNED